MNIVLCGFMGCGKTTCGKIIADRLEYDFVDTDEYMEKKTGKTVNEIFSVGGEAGFRALERAACAELARADKTVIATGGGALCDGGTAEEFRRTSVIYFMNAPFKVLLERLRGDESRPLLRTGNAESLYKKRIPLYTAAAHEVVDAAVSPENISETIIENFLRRISAPLPGR